jgi:hypothetical protein
MDSLTNVPISQWRFKLEKEDNLEVSVVEYFARGGSPPGQFGRYPLKYGNLPGILVKKKDGKEIVFPPELARFVKAQAADRTIKKPQVVKKMIEHTRVGPSGRFATLLQVVSTMDRACSAEGALTASLGTSIVPGLVEVKSAVRLAHPVLLANRGKEVHIGRMAADPQNPRGVKDPKIHDGSWFPDDPFQRAISVDKWWIVSCIDEVQRNDLLLFSNNFIKYGKELGMLIPPPEIEFYAEQVRNGEIEDALDRLTESNSARTKKLVVFILSKSSEHNGQVVRPMLERWSLTRSSVPIMCVRIDTLTNKLMDKSFFKLNLCKANGRLGGENYHVRGLCDVLDKLPALIVGADVYHAGVSVVGHEPAC